MDALLATPGVEMPEIGREWAMLRNLCRECEFSGNDPIASIKAPDLLAALRSIGTHGKHETSHRTPAAGRAGMSSGAGADMEISIVGIARGFAR